MAKEGKKPGKGSEKAARRHVVKKEKPSIRNHDSRQDNVVKKE